MKEIKLPTAAESRKIATTVSTASSIEQFNELAKYITNATNKGERDITYIGEILTSVQKKLTDLGYELSDFDDMRGDTTTWTISW